MPSGDLRKPQCIIPWEVTVQVATEPSRGRTAQKIFKGMLLAGSKRRQLSLYLSVMERAEAKLPKEAWTNVLTKATPVRPHQTDERISVPTRCPSHEQILLSFLLPYPQARIK